MQFQDSLTQLGWQNPIKIHCFEEIDSTNQQLWQLLDENATEGTVVISQRQTAGRGQWGREWESQQGGLYLSLALTPNWDSSQGIHLTLLSAVGIASELRKYDIPVQLKWLNDLILKGYKLGGIKTEIRTQQNKITAAVIGVGINWRNHPPRPGINLEAYPSIESLELLAALVVKGILQSYKDYQDNGIAAILPSYLALFSNIGQAVTVADSPGIVAGVTSQGELIVRLSSPGATTEIQIPPGSIQLGYIEGIAAVFPVQN